MMRMLPIISIRTNPEKETWRYLQLFSKDSYVTKLATEEKAKNQVVSCIRQAAEFYTLSKSATILTKPILLYYGMQRLAKALIFLKNPDVDLKNLRTHGLNGAGISDDIRSFLLNRVPKGKTGVFPEFSKWLTKNNILVEKTVYEKGDYSHKDKWIFECDISDFTNTNAFRVYDLLSLIPELADLFYYFKMKNDMLIPCGLSIRQHSSGELDTLLTISKKLDLNSLQTHFSAIKEYTLKKEEQYQFTMSAERKNEVKLPSPMVQAENGNLFMIASTNDTYKITDARVHYILMFLFCHVARYKAPLLKEIIEGTDKSEYITMIEKFIEVSETKFPKLILDELTGRYFLFTENK